MPRTRIREVFGALESRGLIERIPNRGAVVSRLELDQSSISTTCARCWKACACGWRPRTCRPRRGRSSSTLFGAPMDEFVKAGDFDAFIAVLRALPQPHHRMRAQSRRRPDARQHLREDQRRHPPHHHPAGPRADGPARASRRASRPCGAAMRAEAERLKRPTCESAKETLRRFRKYVL